MFQLGVAKTEGFSIFIQLSSGELEKWGGSIIPDNYALDLQTYTKETIHSLAYKQHQLSAKRIYILDYFGIYALFNADTNIIDWNFFHSLPNEFFSLIATTDQSTYQLGLESDNATTSELPESSIQTGRMLWEFLDLVKNTPSFPVNKLVGFKILHAYLLDGTLERIFRQFPRLKNLTLHACQNVSPGLETLQVNELSELVSIHLSCSDPSPIGLERLFEAASALEEMSLDACTSISGAFNKLRPMQLGQLRELYLRQTDITAKEGALILNALSRIEIINFKDSDNISGFLEQSSIESLPFLREVILSGVDSSDKDLGRLFDIAPRIESLYIKQFFAKSIDLKTLFMSKQYPYLKEISVEAYITEDLLDAFLKKTTATIEAISIPYMSDLSVVLGQLLPNQLPKLQVVNFYHGKPTTKGLHSLWAAAKGIEIINLNSCNSLEGYFAHLLPGQLNKLEEIDLSYSNVSTLDLIALFKTARILRIIKMIKIQNTLNFLTPFNAGELPNLKNIDCSWGEITAAQLIDLFSIATSLEEVTLYDCKTIAGCFAALKAEVLVHLHFLDLSCTDITANDLAAVLNKATSLRELHLDACIDIAGGFEYLQPNQLPHLMTITFNETYVTPEDIRALRKAAPLVNIIFDKELLALHPRQDELSASFFDTNSKTPKYFYNEYFLGVCPSQYRLMLWQPELHTRKAPPIFNPDDFKQIKADKINYSNNPSFSCQEGIKQVNLEDGLDIILPSLDAEEKLFDLRVVSSKGKLLDNRELKVKHSAKTRFYGITLPEPGNYTIYYQVAIPMADKPKLPPELELVLNHCRQFGIAQQSPAQNFATLGDFVTYLRENKMGSCMHRSLVAYQALHTQYLVSIVQNSLHAFIQIEVGGRWYAEDLGGYPAILEKLPITCNTLPKSLQGAVARVPTQFEITDQALDTLLSQPDIPSLILTQSDRDTHYFYTTLSKSYPSTAIFIAHHPEELGLSGQGMTVSGEIKSGHTRFNQWLTHHLARSGVICVDIRDFNANELAQLNDLLDKTIEHQKIPKNIRIFLIDTPERGYYGPDFRRRVPRKTSIVAPGKSQLLPPKDLMPHDARETIEIDLFNSAYWRRTLIGSWQLYKKEGEEAFSWEWQQGALLKSLTAHHIILKNPPLYDHDFTAFITELLSLHRVEWADQVTMLPPAIEFYQTTEFDWPLLAKHTSLHILSTEDIASIYVLSDSNLLSFVQDPTYGFSPETGQLESRDSCLTIHQGRSMNIVCAPGLSDGALAEVLTVAQQRKVRIRFLVPQNIPEESPLQHLKLPIEEKTQWFNPRVRFYLSDDPYFTARQELDKNPNAQAFDLPSLDPTELGNIPSLEDTRSDFLTTGKFSMHAKPSSMARKKEGETTILYGKIPVHLYEALTFASLGYVEGLPLQGELIIIVPLEDAVVVNAMTSQVQHSAVSTLDKVRLLQHQYPDASWDVGDLPFSLLEQHYLKTRLASLHKPIDRETFKLLSDEERVCHFDEQRMQKIQHALAINPWAMLEGITGIGKTHFLQKQLPKEETFTDLKAWLTAQPAPGEKAILIVDEANFTSQFSGENSHFLERFKGLKAAFPGFLWKGENYRLSERHKVIFAFNPSSYAGGREEKKRAF